MHFFTLKELKYLLEFQELLASGKQWANTPTAGPYYLPQLTDCSWAFSIFILRYIHLEPHPFIHNVIFFPEDKFLYQFNNFLKLYWSIAQLASKLKHLLKNFEALSQF